MISVYLCCALGHVLCHPKTHACHVVWKASVCMNLAQSFAFWSHALKLEKTCVTLLTQNYWEEYGALLEDKAEVLKSCWLKRDLATYSHQWGWTRPMLSWNWHRRGGIIPIAMATMLLVNSKSVVLGPSIMEMPGIINTVACHRGLSSKCHHE